MFFLRTPEHGLRIPSPSESLPGRAEPLPVPASVPAPTPASDSVSASSSFRYSP